jgi:hypothetical protein
MLLEVLCAQDGLGALIHAHPMAPEVKVPARTANLVSEFFA